MSEPVFELRDVIKWFGSAAALQGVSLSAGGGTVIGLVGRNGAGKSTLLRCLVGLQRPTSGQITLFGEDPTRLDRSAKQRLGYLSERVVPFPWASVEDLVGVCAPLYPDWDSTLSAELLQRFSINPQRSLSTLSLGQQRAVGLLLALCPRPKLLVLDEPAANLDAVMRREFLQQVLDLVAEAGNTVIFSSHVLTDVERVADRIALLHEGHVLLDREADELREHTCRLRLLFAEEAPEEIELPGALRVRRHGREVLATVDGFTEDLPARLERQTGATVHVQRLGLEELFIDLVGEPEEAGDG